MPLRSKYLCDSIKKNRTPANVVVMPHPFLGAAHPDPAVLKNGSIAQRPTSMDVYFGRTTMTS